MINGDKSTPNSSREYAAVPENVLFDLGGFTGFKTREWEQYLKSEIRRRYPLYQLRQLFVPRSSRWQQNDCIYESLKRYLLFEFGILLPENSLFQVFNHQGTGLLPGEILAAISAVIEPLGLEIDHVMVREPRLRKALGYPEKMTDPGDPSLFENRAGICMIHVKNLYSHAFFWDRMKPDRFNSDKFRLAITIRRQRPLQSPPVYSVLAGLDSFTRMADGCCDASTAAQIHDLARFCSDLVSRQSPDYRVRVDHQLELLLIDLHSQARVTKLRGQFAALLDAAQALRTLFQEANVIC